MKNKFAQLFVIALILAIASLGLQATTKSASSDFLTDAEMSMIYGAARGEDEPPEGAVRGDLGECCASVFNDGSPCAQSSPCYNNAGCIPYGGSTDCDDYGPYWYGTGYTVKRCYYYEDPEKQDQNKGNCEIGSGIVTCKQRYTCTPIGDQPTYDCYPDAGPQGGCVYLPWGSHDGCFMCGKGESVGTPTYESNWRCDGGN